MIVIQETPKEQIEMIINAETITIDGAYNALMIVKEGEEGGLKEALKSIEKNSVLNGIQNQIKRSRGNVDLVSALIHALDTSSALLKYADNYIKTSKTRIYDDNSLTFKDKGVLDWVSTINFFGRYTSIILNIILSEPGKSETKILVKNDLAFFNQTVKYFTHVLDQLCENKEYLIKNLKSLSDELYSEENEQILLTMLKKEQVTTGLAPHQFNPMFYIRRRRMHKDVKIIKRNQEEIKYWVAKIQERQNARDGTNDPAIDYQIQTYSDQITILNSQIKQLMEKYE